MGCMGIFAAFDIGTLLINAGRTINGWGTAFVVLVGTIMLLVAVWQIGKGLMTHGKAQTNWGIAITLLIVGGLFLAAGWNFVNNDLAQGGANTIKDLGNGTWLLGLGL